MEGQWWSIEALLLVAVIWTTIRWWIPSARRLIHSVSVILIVLVHSLINILLGPDSLLTFRGPCDLFSHRKAFAEFFDLALVSHWCSLNLDDRTFLILLWNILIVPSWAHLAVHWSVGNLGSTLKLWRNSLLNHFGSVYLAWISSAVGWPA